MGEGPLVQGQQRGDGGGDGWRYSGEEDPMPGSIPDCVWELRERKGRWWLWVSELTGRVAPTFTKKREKVGENFKDSDLGFTYAEPR